MIRRASRGLHRLAETRRASRCIHGVASEGFAADASLYDRVRPSYPALGVAHALGDVDAAWARILDVASGTGILTRRLLEFGARDVAAVEPVAAMRAEFERKVDAAVRQVNAHAEPWVRRATEAEREAAENQRRRDALQEELEKIGRDVQSL